MAVVLQAAAMWMIYAAFEMHQRAAGRQRRTAVGSRTVEGGRLV